jgi:hypothetical protein
MKHIRLIIFLCLFSCLSVHAQSKKLLQSYEEVVAQATIECDSSMKSGYLHEMALKHAVKGEYVMDITIYEKGKVLSVFAVSSNVQNVKEQNLVKDILKQMQFGFKIPQGKNYKFQHTFKFE